MKMDLIKTNDDVLYEVIKKIPETKAIDVELFKNTSNSTHVFRKDGFYWFVRIIEEAQVIDSNLVN